MWCYSNVRSDPDKYLLHSCIFWDPSATLGITFTPVRFYLTHSLKALLIKRKHSAASALLDLGTQIWTPELPQPIAQKPWPARILPALHCISKLEMIWSTGEFPRTRRTGSCSDSSSFRHRGAQIYFFHYKRRGTVSSPTWQILGAFFAYFS